MSLLNEQSLKILKDETPEGLARLKDRGVSEMKDRLQDVVLHDPLVNRIDSMIRHVEHCEGITLPREDRFAILAYYALIGKLEAEDRLVEWEATHLRPLVIQNP